MSTPASLKKLNNLHYDDHTLSAVRGYIQTGNLPDGMTATKRYYFKRAWAGFEIINGKLVYKPLYLEVVPDDQREKVLQKLYDNIEDAIGKGIRRFHEMVASRYLNIKRKHIVEFLNKQPAFQMTRDKQKHVNKPYLSRYPNQIWSIDLVDLSRYSGHNRQRRYILTCIDHFSKYAWAEPITNKAAADVTDAFQRIVASADGTLPKTCISDNGGEFQGSFDEWLTDSGIKHVKTTSYTPQSNGVIERFNKEIRKYIREGFVRYNGLNYVDHLKEYLDAYNSTKHGTTGHDPATLWVGAAQGDDDGDDAGGDIRQDVAAKIRQKARRMVAKNKARELKRGDYVRVDLTAQYSVLRKMVKQGDKKNIVVKWSPEVYVVDRIVKTDQGDTTLEKRKYTLKTLEGEPVKTRNGGQRKRYFASQLQKVTGAAGAAPALTKRDLFRLNQMNGEQVREETKEEARQTRAHSWRAARTRARAASSKSSTSSSWTITSSQELAGQSSSSGSESSWTITSSSSSSSEPPPPRRSGRNRRPVQRYKP